MTTQPPVGQTQIPQPQTQKKTLLCLNIRAGQTTLRLQRLREIQQRPSPAPIEQQIHKILD